MPSILLLQQILAGLQQDSLGRDFLDIGEHGKLHPIQSLPRNRHGHLIFLGGRLHKVEGHDNFRCLRPYVAHI